MTRQAVRPRPSAWPTVMNLMVFATLISLSIPATHYFGGDAIASAMRWVSLGLLCAMLLLHPQGTVPLRRPRLLDAPAVAFLVLAGASVAYSADTQLTIERALSAALLYIAVFWTMWTYADLVGDVKIADTLLEVATLVFIASVVNLLLTDTSWMRARYRGVMENPNALGMLTILFLPLAVAKWLRQRSIWATALIVLIIGSVAFSGSRNGVMTAAIAVAYMMLRQRRWKVVCFLVALAGVVYFATRVPAGPRAGPTTALGRLVPSEKQSAGGGRIEAWQVAIPIIQQDIALGHGFGTEELIFEGLSFRIHRGMYVHNSYLGLTYQLGLIGTLLLFAPLLWLFFKRAFSPRVPSVQVAAYEAVLFGGLVASFFESWIYSAGNAFAFPFWICVMLLTRITLGAAETWVAPAPASVTHRRPLRFAPVLPQPALSAMSSAGDRRFDPPAQGGRA